MRLISCLLPPTLQATNPCPPASACRLLLYNRYFSLARYRSLFRATHIALTLVNLMDYAWVSRVNLLLGVPDEYLAMGFEILEPLIQRLNTMPMYALVAQLCPRGVEATTFALNMGLIEAGRQVGGYMGLALLNVLGGVEAPSFTNLRTFVLLRSLTRLLPLFFISLLVPEGSPGIPPPIATLTPNGTRVCSSDPVASHPAAAKEPQHDDDDGVTPHTVAYAALRRTLH